VCFRNAHTDLETRFFETRWLGIGEITLSCDFSARKHRFLQEKIICYFLKINRKILLLAIFSQAIFVGQFLAIF
jgi:hypothetical protein